MTYTLPCPHCGAPAELSVQDGNRCKQCGQVVTDKLPPPKAALRDDPRESHRVDHRRTKPE